MYSASFSFAFVCLYLSARVAALKKCKDFGYCLDSEYCCGTSHCCSILSGGAIAGIVIGVILLIAVVVVCVKTNCGSSDRENGRNVIRPVRSARVQMISTGDTPYTFAHPPPQSHIDPTSHFAYNQSLPGAITTGTNDP